MSKFNRPATKPATGPGPIITDTTPTGTTHEGAPGYARDAKSELFLLAVTNMVGEDTFYEQAGDRDTRYAQLVRQVATDDAGWMLEFLRWLRGSANMRSASIVAAAEAVKVRLDAAKLGPDNVHNDIANRSLIDAVLLRADEPGEFLAYWRSRFGKALPQPVKRGVSDAVRRLYTERSLLKYDTASHGYRFGDVLELTHPSPATPDQGHLFRHAIDRRHGRGDEIPDELGVVGVHAELMAWSPEKRRQLFTNPTGSAPTVLREAGMTWESVAGWLQGPMDRAVWEALIPSMGYMALLRNLRNFDQAGVSDDVAEQVAAKLADPAEVARSRQFPFRFFAAYTAVSSLRWGHPLEKALKLSLANVPVLPGRTLVLVDQSPSMFPGYYFSTSPSRSDITNADMAKLFGAALALRAADATLAGYGHTSYVVPFTRGDAVLKLMEKFRMEDGTDAYGAAHDHFDGHDRIVVVTDGENNGTRYRSYKQAGVPDSVPIYTWTLGGYQLGQEPGAPNRHTLGGLTDAAFRLIPLMEDGKRGTWPWMAGPIGQDQPTA